MRLTGKALPWVVGLTLTSTEPSHASVAEPIGGEGMGSSAAARTRLTLASQLTMGGRVSTTVTAVLQVQTRFHAVGIEGNGRGPVGKNPDDADLLCEDIDHFVHHSV